ncbi:hypothetical protein CBR_g2919 [Chara braunii]|uniref:Uncharacterized protein n=1 Tax=Chara braunii TaxID=69332 RepID=A0A388KEE4_CHABU|nr:hypothetical protein CBR_g2919 [Chara braunii]|eukprot:GBG68376.1 hypothetical protein CBR_g2919 [Chara braunii]
MQIFGEVAEGLDTLMRINDAFCDEKGRPFKIIRIRRTHGEDVRLEEDWKPLDETKTGEEIEEMIRKKEAHSRAVVLEMIGDIPDAEMKPPENVLFVCKLNPVTQEDDLEIIFSRFGKVTSDATCIQIVNILCIQMQYVSSVPTGAIANVNLTVMVNAPRSSWPATGMSSAVHASEVWLMLAFRAPAVTKLLT